jgi:hypothetical protein
MPWAPCVWPENLPMIKLSFIKLLNTVYAEYECGFLRGRFPQIYIPHHYIDFYYMGWCRFCLNNTQESCCLLCFGGLLPAPFAGVNCEQDGTRCSNAADRLFEIMDLEQEPSEKSNRIITR